MGDVIHMQFPQVCPDSGFPDVIDAPGIYSTEQYGIGGSFTVWPKGEPEEAQGGLILHKGDWTGIYLREGDALYLECSFSMPPTIDMVRCFMFASLGAAEYKGTWFGYKFKNDFGTADMDPLTPIH